MKWADFLVSKVQWKNDVKQIDRFLVHADNDKTVGAGVERDRNWVVQKFGANNTFACISKNEKGEWVRGSQIKYLNGSISVFYGLPLIITKRKSFISYFHKDDQSKKVEFENITSDVIVNKSVGDGDISTDVSQEYIKQLIQKEFLYDTTVLIVLVGPKTKCRKHIDWEISGALDYKIGDVYAGLLGLLLPSHPDYGTGKCSYDNLPGRLTDNFKSGYAVIRDYTTDRVKLQEYIELAFSNRKQKENERINSRAQMQRNTCE